MENALQSQQRAWLFSRGPRSVRIVRVADLNSPVRLLVYGPGQDVVVYEERGFVDCIIRQSALERKFVAEGYQLQPFRSGDRRSGRDRRTVARGLDRRRPPAELQADAGVSS